MAKVTFTGDYNTFFKPSNTPFKDLIEEASWRGTYVKRIGTDGQITVNDVQDLSIPVLMAIINAGMVIEGYPVFIKMSAATYASDVPVGISNRSYEDEDGNTVVRKWNAWKDSTHEHFDATDGDKLVAGNSGYGAELSSAEIKILYDNADYTVLTASEFQGELPDDGDN